MTALIAALEMLETVRYLPVVESAVAILRTGIAELTRERDELIADVELYQKNITAENDACYAATERAEAAEARVAELEAQVMPLRAFANEVIKDWPEGAPDGGGLQEYAMKHGLFREVTMAGPCGECCGCSEFLSADDWPNECYRHTSLLTGKPETDAAIDALAGPRGQPPHRHMKRGDEMNESADDIADEMTSWALQRMTSSRTDKTMMIQFAERLRETQKSSENQALRVI